jgi:cell division GTPase FtsZ
MRILAIGMGGAGGRIVDMLYQTDRRRSKVACVEALAVDVDAESLTQLTSLPETSKLYFPPIDLTNQQDAPGSGTTATIDINEVTARVHTMSTGETDAIIICAGLGGGLVDAAPHLIAALRISVVEPIFGLVTLPCLSEGERCSAKAADDIEIISPLLDGVIIFDNETWYKKIKAQQKSLAREERSFATKIGLKKKPKKELSPVQRDYLLLNEALVRRISLILRAGEFKADGGLELAEVVLDSGEVLNTMKGMGFITIGYAVEQLVKNPLDFLKKWRPTGFFADEHQKKASRIIELAKQAIYHDITTPCDLTSAQKALILVAGPSHEISLKGYMTVRKWIDRSIAGLETRSGDYPVTSTKFVAIIIMLTGLKNIPRIKELKEIRTQYREHLADEKAPREEGVPRQEGIVASSRSSQKPTVLKDRMISLPGEKHPSEKGGAGKTGKDSPYPSMTTRVYASPSPSPESQGDLQETVRAKTGNGHRRHVIVTKPHEPILAEGPLSTPDKKPSTPIKKILASRVPPPSQDKTIVTFDDRTKLKEQERKKIERELQKQRLMAMSGKDPQFDRNQRKIHGMSDRPQPPDTSQEIPARQEMQKIVLHKRKTRADDGFSPKSPQEGEKSPSPGAPVKDTQSVSERGSIGKDDTFDVWIRQASNRKKDGLFDRESFKLKEASPTVSDEALLHTDLKRPRNTVAESDEMRKEIPASEMPGTIDTVVKKSTKTE